MKAAVILLLACIACSASAVRWSSSGIDGSVGGSPVNPTSVATHLVASDDLDIPISVTVTAARDVPLDFFLVQDLSGSYFDDIVTLRALAGNLVTALNAEYSSVHYGIGSFVDKPIGFFGSPPDYEYRTDLALTSDGAAFQAGVNSLVVLGGGDGPESQFSALHAVGRRADTAEIGFRPDAFRVAFMTTDAPPHVAGDCDPPLCPVANDGDGILEAEDYPSSAQVAAALTAGKIVPIIASTSVGYYSGHVASWGFGSVVPLSSNSANIIDAIRAGIASAKRDVNCGITANGGNYGVSLTPAAHLGVSPGATVVFTLKMHCGAVGRECINDQSVVVSCPGFGTTTVTADVNQAPSFVPPFPAPVISVLRNTPVSFNVKCQDPDAGDSLTILGSSFPAGASLGSFVGTNPRTGTFNWTPLFGGSFLVRFDCRDQTGKMASPLFVRINVDPCPFHLGVAADFNVVATESFTATSGDIEGRLAVGGPVSINHYSVGHSLPVGRAQPSYDLIANGLLNFPTGTVGVGPNDGEIVHGSAASVLPEENSYGDAFLAPGFLPWAGITANLASTRNLLNGLPASGTWSTEWGTMTLKGTDPVENIFDMNTSDMEAAHTLIFDVPASSVAIIRIHGATAVLQSKGMFLAGWAPADSRRNKNLFFYPDATDLTVQWISVQGSILANRANFNCPSGLIEGQVWTKRWNGNCQVNYHHMVTCRHYETAPRIEAASAAGAQLPRAQQH